MYILVPLKQFYNLGSRILISLFTEIWDVYTALSVVNLGAGSHSSGTHTTHLECLYHCLLDESACTHVSGRVGRDREGLSILLTPSSCIPREPRQYYKPRHEVPEQMFLLRSIVASIEQRARQSAAFQPRLFNKRKAQLLAKCISVLVNRRVC